MGRAFQAARLELVSNAMAQMLTHERISELYAKEWGVTRRTVRRYIAEVERVWRERGASPQAVEERRSFFTETALVILRKQIGKGHDASAMKTLDTLARWYGIGVPQLATAIGVYSDQGLYTSGSAVTAALAELRAKQLPPGDFDDDRAAVQAQDAEVIRALESKRSGGDN